ncbi:hypothetical protein CEUSTIGMA_g1355.t1 [Chlamydomonas eustigma]|uniref:RING-type domain-containing protein n=1 Tax=Chlamydomonas eustigma TaxID=1157962 RepID=A0A250WSV5_9CHLO|nr:hypothetical protein CEUSTIGMA_g1355.t1 [Chlamydomonas eustigma]|eukprot:GAX73905.1 hypothetical protein CEUSTIGMA_g1355.t1 [Chlamydomonas eustigma]
MSTDVEASPEIVSIDEMRQSSGVQAGPSGQFQSNSGRLFGRGKELRPANTSSRVGSSTNSAIVIESEDEDAEVVVVTIKPGISRRLSMPFKRPRPLHGQLQQPTVAIPTGGGLPAGFQQPGPQSMPPQQQHQQPSSPEGRKCAICLEKMETMASTPCGHVFCHQCLLDCVKVGRKCPKCRKAVQVKQIHRIYMD